jgi:hypothetical protein
MTQRRGDAEEKVCTAMNSSDGLMPCNGSVDTESNLVYPLSRLEFSRQGVAR